MSLRLPKSAPKEANGFLHQENIAVVTKTSRLDRVRENSAALNLRLSESVLTELDRAFPPPRSSQKLEFL